jgi:hypothetical protein
MRAWVLFGITLVFGCARPHKEGVKGATSAVPAPSEPILAPSVNTEEREGAATATATSTGTGEVTVTNIGIHIGGGPNDPATKEPVVRSLAPHFDEFRRCYALVENPRAGDFGVDLLIEKDGGHAKVDNPRTTLGRAFSDCMVGAFAAADFEAPRTGRTKVSYSLSFRPAK